ncbi:MAG TPA: YdeI/OmpD-associated family protein [Pyrinomonadaceae bacterium]|nr:YdeI/OmpD-associated family protein [Pyrinomonadaceae bacterium]
MNPKFFPTQNDFREWLEENHEIETELLVGFYKVGSGKASMTWGEAVDQALCFGWIDGVKRSIDKESYSHRFTPRKANSNWSAVNIKKVEDLTAKGLMKPAGIAAFEKRREDRSAIYAYEIEQKEFSGEFLRAFRANEKAWEFFERQANWYKRTITHWVLSAKQAETRKRRLEKLIAESENEKRLR